MGEPRKATLILDWGLADDRDRDLLLAELAEDTEARAVIVAINSPGGTTAGSEALFDSLRRIAAEKPVVAQIGEMAASGGYVAAIAADHVVARGNSLTGSIGVIMEYPDLTEAMSRLGIGWETVRSSELKAEPSPFRPTSPAARALDEAMVADSFAWFRGLVGERRGLEGGAGRGLAPREQHRRAEHGQAARAHRPSGVLGADGEPQLRRTAVLRSAHGRPQIPNVLRG